MKKSKKEEQLASELEDGIGRGRVVVAALQEAYEECLGLLANTLKGDKHS